MVTVPSGCRGEIGDSLDNGFPEGEHEHGAGMPPVTGMPSMKKGPDGKEPRAQFESSITATIAQRSALSRKI